MDRDEIDVELLPVDEGILDILEEGRATRQYLADELEYSGEYIYQRIRRLVEHDVVEVIHDGFYRIATDGGEVQERPDPAGTGPVEPNPREPREGAAERRVAPSPDPEGGEEQSPSADPAGSEATTWPTMAALPRLHVRDEPRDDLECEMRAALDELDIPGQAAEVER